MPLLSDSTTRLACRLLRLSVVIQCLGNAWWFGRLGETPVFSLLWESPELGGFGVGESTVRTLHQVLAIVWLVAGVVVAVQPQRWALGLLAAMQAMIAVAYAAVEGGFRLDVSALPPGGEVLTLAFPLFSQSARVAAPLGMLLLMSNRHTAAINCLRWTAAATFIAHGFEAAQHYHIFNELNLAAADRLLGIELPQATSEQLLTVIGILDIVVGVVVLIRRSPIGAGYMAVWGLITASSRVVAFGWDIGGWGFATRVPHALVPAALLVCWWSLTWSKSLSKSAAPDGTETQGASE